MLNALTFIKNKISTGEFSQTQYPLLFLYALYPPSAASDSRLVDGGEDDDGGGGVVGPSRLAPESLCACRATLALRSASSSLTMRNENMKTCDSQWRPQTCNPGAPLLVSG